jgi:aryl-alcohol dehydrogenase-like predicted oxidoreductase
MRYTLLGDSGLRVSEVCLGTMTFGTDWGWGADEDASRRQFELFTEAGGNFIDTANKYTDGSAETIVGRLLAGQRDSFVLATKYSLSTRAGDLNAGGNHRKNLVQALEASLRRLGTEHVDVLWLHAWDYLTPVEEVARALDDQVRAGKVLYVGVSDTTAWIVAQMQTIARLRGWSPFIGLQIPYSLVQRDVERELLPMARALGLGVTAWSPLGDHRSTAFCLVNANFCQLTTNPSTLRSVTRGHRFKSCPPLPGETGPQEIILRARFSADSEIRGMRVITLARHADRLRPPGPVRLRRLGRVAGDP